MSTSRPSYDYDAIARRHGIAIQSVSPATFEQRLEELRATLNRKDVPYPIASDKALSYLRAAEAGVPFRVGTLCDESIELGGYWNEQKYEEYTFEEHLSWACLIAEQQRTKHRYACREYLEGERIFEIGGNVIPDFYLLNARIYQQTQWQLATVNTIIPAELFFTCHSHRFFPVTTFMRPLEQDYLQEPDIGHDVAGHVSTFTIPVVAQLMRSHGLARDRIYDERDRRLNEVGSDELRRQIQADADELLFFAQRIYWFTVEFGLVLQGDEVRAFGAGILSSPGETIYSIDSEKPNRILIDPSNDHDLLRLATTDYLISEFQKTYFVMKCFSLLESLSPERIVWAARQAQMLPHFTWREIAPGDSVMQVGREYSSTQEKYLAWMADHQMDECLARTTLRNLRMASRGCFDRLELAEYYRVAPPPIPIDALELYRKRHSTV